MFLTSSLQKLLRHWKFICGCASIIFLLNVVYIVSQISHRQPRIKVREQQQQQGTINTIGAHPAHIIHKLVNSTTKFFTCTDNSKTVELLFFNDDFCDCVDGSDEPGTNACNNGQYDFYIFFS